MKYLVLISLFLNITFAQIDSLSEALQYYPIQEGNYWEYKNYYWDPPSYSDSSAHSIEIIGDTILSNSNNYKILLQKNIPDNGFSSRVYERVDTVTACVYRYSSDTIFISNEYLVDSLQAQPGDYFAGSRTGYSSFGNGIFNTLCVAEYEDTVLELITDVKELQDQSFIPGLNYVLAKKLGFISSISCEFGCSSTILVYAQIDGEKYGSKITDIERQGFNLNPNNYTLSQNYPNPLNPATTIRYQTPERSFITIKVYDVLGNEVVTLVNEEKPAGVYEVEFNSSGLTSGIYFYQLQAGEFTAVKKMILLK